MTQAFIASPPLTARPLRCRNCGAERAAAPIAICEECLGPLDPVYEPGRPLPARETIAGRPPRQRCRRARGPRRPQGVDLRPRRTRSGEADRHERLRRPPGARAGDVRRRQSIVRPGGGPVRLGDRERQSAQLLRRGLEDRRLRDRRAARLAAAHGGGRADGGGLARLEAAQGVRRVSRGGPGGRPAATVVRGAGRGMRPDRAAGGARRRCARAGGAADHLPLARDRQPRGWRLRRAGDAGDRWLGRSGERSGAGRGHPISGRGHGRVRRDGGRCDRRRRARPGARGTARTPRRSGALHHWPWLEDGRGGARSAPRGPGDRAAPAGRNDSRGGGTDMAITLNLPSVLAAHTGGARTIEATGRTLGEAVADVAARYPALAPRLRDKDGKPYPFVNFYLNDEDVRFRGGFAAPVQDGDEVTVIPAIA